MRDGRSGDVLIPDDTCGTWIDRVNWNFGIKESGEKQPGIEPGTGKKDLKNFCTIEKISHLDLIFIIIIFILQPNEVYLYIIS